MSELPTTSYALLGLLSFGDELTGYELKQRADNTMRFYWVSPAMSQVYTELGRLTGERLVDERTRTGQGRTTRHYCINEAGRERLRGWLTRTEPEFPVLKHPFALRLMLGHLVGPAEMHKMLQRYVDLLDAQRKALQEVLDSITERPGFEYPTLVATWGLALYTGEEATVATLRERLRALPGSEEASQPGTSSPQGRG